MSTMRWTEGRTTLVSNACLLPLGVCVCVCVCVGGGEWRWGGGEGAVMDVYDEVERRENDSSE